MSRLTNPDWIAPHRARAYYLESNFPKYEEQCLFYNKLKEYENLGSVEDLKGIHQANQRCEKILETSLMVSQNNRLLSHELEVYKRALELAFKSVRVEYDGYCYFEFNGSELYWTTDTTKLMEACLNQAKKELEQ